MILEIPKQAVVNRIIPKDRFNFDDATKIGRIRWLGKLGPTTINLPAKKIQEIEENRTEKTSKKIEFHNEITGKIIFVETRKYENGEIETRASAAKEPFKQQLGKYIEYKNIFEAAKDILKNDFIEIGRAHV